MRGEANVRRLGRRWRWLGLVLAVCLVGAGSAQARPFVYVGNGQADVVTQFDVSAGGVLAPLSPPAVVSGGTTDGVAVAPDARSVYVVSFFGDAVWQYDVGAGGALSSKSPATVSTGSGAAGVAVSPDGRSVYVTNAGASTNPPDPRSRNTVSQYSVGAGGVLIPKTPATVAAGDSPSGIAVSPDGKSVYVTNINPPTFVGSVSQYDVGPGGVLSPKSLATVPIPGSTAGKVAVTPDGKNVYVTSPPPPFPCPPLCFSGVVSQFAVGSGGGLAPHGTVVAGDSPAGIAVSPDGRSAYVTVAGRSFGAGSTVWQYDVGASGALAPKSPPTVSSGRAPSGVAVAPDGNSVYVTNAADNTLSQYDIGGGGTLSPKSPPSVANAGGVPDAIAVTPLVPTSKDQCKNDGWRNFPQFRNQGDCVSFVQTGK